MDVTSEEVFSTIPDPYQVGPKFSSITLGSIELTDATNQIIFGPGPTNITLSVATPAADRTISISDPGASASIVLTEGNQTINGTKSFTSLAADEILPVTPGNGVEVGLIRIAEDTLVTPAMTLDSLRSISGVANVSFAIRPLGTGAFLVDEPNNAASGGNIRGSNAVDLQMIRSGASQVASGDWSVICGGERNTASGDYSVICGGFDNASLGTGAVVCGGESNTSSALDCVVCGGAANEANLDYSGVVAGNINIVNGSFSLIGAGNNNTNDGTASFIGAGGSNEITDGDDNAIVSGSDNVTGSSRSFIGGGQTNIIGPGSNVCNWSAIVCGATNTITSGATHAIIGAGNLHTLGASATRSGIFCGQNNSINSADCFIGSGSDHTLTGDYSAIIGGQSCVVAGTHSLAFGNQAQANNNGVVTLSDSTAAAFANTAADQFNARFANGYRFTGGAATISGGALFATSGGTPSNLNFYQTLSTTLNITGIYAAPQTFTYAVTRNGANVSMTWQQALSAATVATVISSATALPAWAAPTNTNPMMIPIWVTDNGAGVMGSMRIDNAGNIVIYVGFGGNFTGAGSSGPNSGTAAWTII